MNFFDHVDGVKINVCRLGPDVTFFFLVHQGELEYKYKLNFLFTRSHYNHHFPPFSLKLLPKLSEASLARTVRELRDKTRPRRPHE